MGYHNSPLYRFFTKKICARKIFEYPKNTDFRRKGNIGNRLLGYTKKSACNFLVDFFFNIYNTNFCPYVLILRWFEKNTWLETNIGYIDTGYYFATGQKKSLTI